MEPDFERILSKKIREAEERPVSWNKQVVWQNVRMETGTGRRNYFFYYVAAAIIMFVIYFAVQPVRNEIKSSPAADAKIEPKSTPAESMTSVVPGAKQDHVAPPTFRRPANTALRRTTQIKNRVKGKTQSPQPEIQLIDATVEPVANVQIPVEDLVLPEGVTLPEQKIRPVVGIIIESYSETAANVKRKKRLRKLQPSDETPWENPGNALVFAMRK